MPATCHRLWYINYLKQVKEKHISILAPGFPDMDVAQFKACVTHTVPLDRDQVLSLSSSKGFTYPSCSIHLPPLDCISEKFWPQDFHLCKSEED
jgi:hypothetical protein